MLFNQKITRLYYLYTNKLFKFMFNRVNILKLILKSREN
jgi:hypothetical protein